MTSKYALFELKPLQFRFCVFFEMFCFKNYQLYGIRSMVVCQRGITWTRLQKDNPPIGIKRLVIVSLSCTTYFFGFNHTQLILNTVKKKLCAFLRSNIDKNPASEYLHGALSLGMHSRGSLICWNCTETHTSTTLQTTDRKVYITHPTWCSLQCWFGSCHTQQSSPVDPRKI